jgi:hypothetical protein
VDAKAEEVVDVGDIADLADGGLKAGDVGELIDLTTEGDHAPAGPDADAGGEVAETEGERHPNAVGESLVPGVIAAVPRADVDCGPNQGGEAQAGTSCRCTTAGAGAGMEEEGGECDDCGAGGGCRELEDPGHD